MSNKKRKKNMASSHQSWSRGNGTQEAKYKIIKKRDYLNMELMQLLEQESAAESMREQQLLATKDEVEYKRLEKIFGVERAKASERIISMSNKHDAII